MMPYQDIFIQLIDTPPLTKDFSPPWLKEILIQAEGLLVVFDITKPREIEEFFEILKKINLGNKKKILIGNKADLTGAKEDFFTLKKRYPLKLLSCQEKEGIEDLKEEIFHLLEIARIYSKKPNQDPDFAHPFTCKKGTKLIDFAGQIHLDLIENFKYARLFGKNLKTPLIIGKEYILKDGDVVEIHG
jgi:ribosome-interacting GTPase 1